MIFCNLLHNGSEIDYKLARNLYARPKKELEKLGKSEIDLERKYNDVNYKYDLNEERIQSLKEEESQVEKEKSDA